MESPSFTTPVSTDVPRAKKSRAWIIAVIIGVLLAGGFFAYRNFSTSQAEPTPTPTQAPTETPTPTEDPSVTPTETPTPTRGEVKSAYDMNIQVLNGTGEEGAAASVSAYLSDKGYKHLETGNADNFDYQNITLKIKDSMNKFLSQLKKDLAEKYNVNDDVGALPEDALFDATVTVGK